MNTKVSLIPVAQEGTPRGYTGPLPEVTGEVFRATAELYTTVGFEEPWIGYLAEADGTPVGTCGFKGPPRDGRVEIAYFTFPEFEGRGFASAMAARLVTIARQHGSPIVVAAQTLPERNASHRVLEKLGFRQVETIEHPEDGTVWEWQLIENAGT
jgi:ribosomal-protein-alanine N-acetyltransferase